MLRLEADRTNDARAVDDGVGRPERDVPGAGALARRVDRERIVDARLVRGVLHAVAAAVGVVDAEEGESLRPEVADHLDVLRDRLHAGAAPGGPEVDDDHAALQAGPEIATAGVERIGLARGAARPLGDGDRGRRLAHHRAMGARVTRAPEPRVGELVRRGARVGGARRGRREGGGCHARTRCGHDGHGEERAERWQAAEFAKHGGTVPPEAVEARSKTAVYGRFSAERARVA